MTCSHVGKTKKKKKKDIVRVESCNKEEEKKPAKEQNSLQLNVWPSILAQSTPHPTTSETIEKEKTCMTIGEQHSRAQFEMRVAPASWTIKAHRKQG